MVVGLVGCGNWRRHNIVRDLVALECEVPVVARSAASIARAQEKGAATISADIGSLLTSGSRSRSSDPSGHRTRQSLNGTLDGRLWR